MTRATTMDQKTKDLLERMREAWRVAWRAGNGWEMNFLKSIAPRVKRGQPLSEKQQLCLNKILDLVRRGGATRRPWRQRRLL